MKQKYLVVMRGPGISGPVVAMSVKDVYTYKDNDKFKRTQSEAARKLKNLTGEEPTWDRKKLTFSCEMTEEQAKEMKSWLGVKQVLLVE